MYKSFARRREEFFDFAHRREAVRLAKEAGQPKPWTDDPILQNNRFCNVHREDDATTVWFAQNMRDNHGFQMSDEAAIMTTVAFRWFNKIEIGKILMDPRVGLQDGEFRPSVASNLILGQYPKGPFVTGAYIIKTPDGLSKLDGVLRCITVFKDMLQAEKIKSDPTSIEKTWESFKTVPFCGPFMAYEVVTDLYHTPVLSGAQDKMTWANPGPGCARGISRIFSNDCSPDTWSRSSEKGRTILLGHMRDLLVQSQTIPWIQERPWDMRTIEHLACETDKYERCVQGGRMKQRYNGAAA